MLNLVNLFVFKKIDKNHLTSIDFIEGRWFLLDKVKLHNEHIF